MKTIRLKGMNNVGVRVLVDDDVFDVLKTKDLKYKDSDDTNKYVYWNETKGGKRQTIKLHRWVVRCNDPNLHVDHIDGNPLNNQRENLRIATRTQNNRNRKSFKNSSSQYKGVSKNPSGTFRCQLGKDGEVFALGTFKSEVEAAENYDYHAIREFGEFAKLNFPEKDYSGFQPRQTEL